VTYLLEVSDSRDFSRILVTEEGLTDSTYTFAAPSDVGIYYWRVKAVDGAGNESDWSAAGSFAVEERGGSTSIPRILALIFIILLLVTILAMVLYLRRRNEEAGDVEVVLPGDSFEMDEDDKVTQFFESLKAEQMVRQRPAKGHRSAVSSQLRAAKTGDRTIDRQIDETVELIDKGFDDKLWVDDLHLDKRIGELVFAHHRTAIEHIIGILGKLSWEIPYLERAMARNEVDSTIRSQEKAKYSAMVALMPLLQGTVEGLVDQSQELAAVSISEAEGYKGSHNNGG
jgi:hypothetical protein